MFNHRGLLPRIGATVAGVAGVLALSAGPAAAQVCYPPGPNCVTTTTQAALIASITLSDDTLFPGQTFTVTVTGFDEGAGILVSIQSHPRDLATGTADAQGRASINATIPRDMELGRHTIVATGRAANGQVVALRAPVTIVAAAAAVAPVVNRPVTQNQSVSAVSGSTSTATKGRLAKTGATFLVPTAAAGFALVGTGIVLTRSVKKRKAAAA